MCSKPGLSSAPTPAWATPTATLRTRIGDITFAIPQVSRAADCLDEEFAKWRSRRLDAEPYPYLALNARYEKVRVDVACSSKTDPDALRAD